MPVFQFFFSSLGKPVFLRSIKTAGMYGEKKLRKKSTEFEFSSHNVKDGTASNPFDTVARTFD